MILVEGRIDSFPLSRRDSVCPEGFVPCPSLEGRSPPCQERNVDSMGRREEECRFSWMEDSFVAFRTRFQPLASAIKKDLELYQRDRRSSPMSASSRERMPGTV